MIEELSKWVIYPIIPAFTDKDYLDVDAIQKYLQYLYENGCRTVLTTAGTSRFNMLSNIEALHLNETVSSSFQGNSIVGLPPLSDKLLQQFIRQTNKIKPAAALLMYPDRYYGDDNIVSYFFRAADALEVPVMVHGMFMRNATGGMYEFQPQLVEKIKQHENIIGLKEESMSFDLAYKVSRKADDKFLIFPAGGSCRRYLITEPAGAQTFLGGIGNIFPIIENTFLELMKEGKYTQAQHIVREYEEPLFECFGKIGWHRALQTALHHTGLMRSANRLPFAPATPEMVKSIMETLTFIQDKFNTQGFEQ